MTQAIDGRIVLLGTGGTIAGLGADVGYRAGAVPVERLLGAAAGAGASFEFEQVAQIDSKDLAFTDWCRLIEAVDRQLARPEVAGLIVTHGTDTLEESAWLLQRLYAPVKPVVLVGAMRPTDSPQSDGPQNLSDAIAVVTEPGARGVVAMVAGRILGALDVRKDHPYRLAAFGAGEAGPIGVVEGGVVRRFRAWPGGTALGRTALPADPARWPIVEIVVSHAGARGRLVDLLVADGVAGIVVATTGNGSLHAELEAALERAEGRGVEIRRALRWLDGAIIDAPGARFRSCGAATPVQARVDLVLELARRPARGDPAA